MIMSMGADALSWSPFMLADPRLVVMASEEVIVAVKTLGVVLCAPAQFFSQAVGLACTRLAPIRRISHPVARLTRFAWQ